MNRTFPESFGGCFGASGADSGSAGSCSGGNVQSGRSTAAARTAKSPNQSGDHLTWVTWFRQKSRGPTPQGKNVTVLTIHSFGRLSYKFVEQEKEVALGGSAPRILSIDDYFLMDDGVPPVWTSELEEQYRQNLIKSFKRNLDDGHFAFIIVDSLNLKESDVLDLAVPARMRGFAVYLVDLPLDNDRPGETRKCNDQDLQTMKDQWEKAPASVTQLDIEWLLNPQKDEPKDPEEVSTPENIVTSTTAPIDDVILFFLK